MKLNDYLIPAQGPRSWKLFLSLPANLAHALLLINYSAQGADTPTEWPATVIPRLSRSMRIDAEALGVLLAHGAALRDFFLLNLPLDHPAHQRWPALREWIAELTVADIEQVMSNATRSNLRDYRLHMEPLLEAEQWLDRLGTTAPQSSLLVDKKQRRIALNAVLAILRVKDPEPVLTFFEHPKRLRSALLSFLDEIWKNGFEEEWERHRPLFMTTVDTWSRWFSSERLTLSEDMLRQVTEQQFSPDVIHRIHQASSVTFVPSLFLGTFLSLATLEDTLYVFYEPTKEPHLPVAHEATKDMTAMSSALPTPAQPLDLEQLGLVMVVLGDSTSLTILRILAQHGDLFAQQVADKMEVHQSTTSRHFAQLERSGLVLIRRSGGIKHYSVNKPRIQEACYSLLKIFE